MTYQQSTQLVNSESMRYWMVGVEFVSSDCQSAIQSIITGQALPKAKNCIL